MYGVLRPTAKATSYKLDFHQKSWFFIRKLKIPSGKSIDGAFRAQP